ncbi:hypothetical protein DEI83_00785 [Curtobacterium sp. MCBD17_021]|nr:hypothetical protein DEI83_00785 [Curtobacterium sp. MCBD17_021]
MHGDRGRHRGCCLGRLRAGADLRDRHRSSPHGLGRHVAPQAPRRVGTGPRGPRFLVDGHARVLVGLVAHAIASSRSFASSSSRDEMTYR